jgi:large subunit ribosomal protein L9
VTSSSSSRPSATRSEKRQVDLHEPIKALGVYRVPIRLHADVKPEIKVWVIKQ